MTLSAIYKISDTDRLPLLQHSLNQLPSDVESVVISGVETQVPCDTWEYYPNSSLTEARNRGVELASHDHVAFIDDDAYPSEQWYDTIKPHLDEYDMLGGPLYPDYRSGKIDWLPKGWHWLIGCGPYYDESQVVPNTYGSNLVIRKKAFDAVDGFDESIGMGSDGVGQGGETDLCRRIRDAGYTGVFYHPDAIMYHVIDGRNDVKELHRRAFEQGIAKAAIGVGDRESDFVKKELTALGKRSLKRGFAGLTLTGMVGMGYLYGKLTP